MPRPPKPISDTVDDVTRLVLDRAERSGLNMAELAALAGVHQDTVTGWRQGRSSVDGRALSRLRKPLGLRIDAPRRVNAA